MTRITPDNPIGLDGFEFLEFYSAGRGIPEDLYAAMGFTQIARHRSKDAQLWRQGNINFIANYEPRSSAAYFAAEHGPSACGMGFRVEMPPSPMPKPSGAGLSRSKSPPARWNCGFPRYAGSAAP